MTLDKVPVGHWFTYWGERFRLASGGGDEHGYWIMYIAQDEAGKDCHFTKHDDVDYDPLANALEVELHDLS